MQRVQGRDRQVLRIDLKESAQGLARIAAAESIGAQRKQARNPGCDLLADQPHVIAYGDAGAVESLRGLLR